MMGRVNARGISSIEAAVGAAIVGSVLAVAVPSFVRELHASRLTEPVSGLERLGAAAVAYAQGRAAGEAFPASAPLTPSVVPRGERVVDPPGTWDAPTWRALGFQAAAEGEPHAFAFGFDSVLTPSRGSFVAHAHGDLDGDGVTSTFEVRGHTVDGEPTGAALEPGMYVENEVE
jgi:hypothetical protein